MNDLVHAARHLSDYASIRNFLYGLRYHGAKYGLQRMREFVELMGNPQKDLPVIHVAGTNGKGSTSAMLEQIFRDQSYRTGFYSSPHLIRQGERIQVNRVILSEEDIVRLTKKMVAVLLENPDTTSDDWPSFFEFMTAMGFVRFAECEVDIAFIETGLGGRLDATNILNPDLSIITSISLDHTQILGDTLEEIAVEKAGIIKNDTPVVIGKLPPSAEKVIRSIARERNATVFSVRERWGQDFSDYPQPNLMGEYQQINAGVALLACEALNHVYPTRYRMDSKKASASLSHVDWPGRWETVDLNEGERIILDATHNEEGARMLELNLQRLIKESGCKPIIVAGSLGEDRAKVLMEAVCKYADEVYLLHPNQPRALTFEQLRACVPRSYTGEIHDSNVSDLFQFQKLKIDLKEGQPLVVTGSIYLIGEVSDLLKSTPVANQQSLQDVV